MANEYLLDQKQFDTIGVAVHGLGLALQDIDWSRAEDSAYMRVYNTREGLQRVYREAQTIRPRSDAMYEPGRSSPEIDRAFERAYDDARGFAILTHYVDEARETAEQARHEAGECDINGVFDQLLRIGRIQAVVNGVARTARPRTMLRREGEPSTTEATNVLQAIDDAMHEIKQTLLVSLNRDCGCRTQGPRT